MKEKIHPDYKETVITCGCGERIATRSTRQNIAVAICSKCHPFFTGKQKFVDTAGRVEKFRRRYGWKIEGETKAEPKPAPEAPAPEKPEKK